MNNDLIAFLISLFFIWSIIITAMVMIDTKNTITIGVVEECKMEIDLDIWDGVNRLGIYQTITDCERIHLGIEK